MPSTRSPAEITALCENYEMNSNDQRARNRAVIRARRETILNWKSQTQEKPSDNVQIEVENAISPVLNTSSRTKRKQRTAEEIKALCEKYGKDSNNPTDRRGAVQRDNRQKARDLISQDKLKSLQGSHVVISTRRKEELDDLCRKYGLNAKNEKDRRRARYKHKRETLSRIQQERKRSSKDSVPSETNPFSLSRAKRFRSNMDFNPEIPAAEDDDTSSFVPEDEIPAIEDADIFLFVPEDESPAVEDARNANDSALVEEQNLLNVITGQSQKLIEHIEVRRFPRRFVDFVNIS